MDAAQYKSMSDLYHNLCKFLLNKNIGTLSKFSQTESLYKEAADGGTILAALYGGLSSVRTPN
jgi:hypothetical protein